MQNDNFESRERICMQIIRTNYLRDNCSINITLIQSFAICMKNPYIQWEKNNN